MIAPNKMRIPTYQKGRVTPVVGLSRTMAGKKLFHLIQRLEGNAVGDAGSNHHSRVGHEPLPSLMVAAPDCRPNGPFYHRSHHEADEPQGGSDYLAPAWVVGVATLDAQWNRNACHRESHQIRLQSTELKST